MTGGGTETIRIGVSTDYITNDFGENATWTHSSDRRVKKDIKDNELGLDFINKLKTRNFKKKHQVNILKNLTNIMLKPQKERILIRYTMVS